MPVYVCMHVHIEAHRGLKRASDFPGAGITDSWECPEEDSGNQLLITKPSLQLCNYGFI